MEDNRMIDELERWQEIILINALITLIITTVFAFLIVIFAYNERGGCFNIGIEYLLIGFVAGFTPVLLLQIEKRL